MQQRVQAKSSAFGWSSCEWEKIWESNHIAEKEQMVNQGELYLFHAKCRLLNIADGPLASSVGCSEPWGKLRRLCGSLEYADFSQLVAQKAGCGEMCAAAGVRTSVPVCCCCFVHSQKG